MSEPLKAAGGLCAPVWTGYEDPRRQRDGIVPNFDRIEYSIDHFRKGSLRDRLWRFFAWDKGWGFPLRGWGIPTPMRELLPVFTAQRGGITFAKISDSGGA